MEESNVIIIAEAGVNHNGSLEEAYELASAAKASGADYVKFQIFSASDLVLEGTPKAEYQKKCPTPGIDQYEMLKQLELTQADFRRLSQHCSQIGIGFACSSFSSEGLDLLLDIGVDFLKIPSGEITNVPLVRQAARSNKMLIISTGMASMEEIDHCISLVTSVRKSAKKVALLQCTTEYPAPISDANLRVMDTLFKRYGVRVGYSDHTLGFEASLAAVALGATIIEKHITLDRDQFGPDHFASLESDEFLTMVNMIRNIEKSLGTAVKRTSSIEKSNLLNVRRSIVAKTHIKKGEPFSEANLVLKRPATGICASKWDEFIGMRSDKDYEAGDLIEE